MTKTDHEKKSLLSEAIVKSPEKEDEKGRLMGLIPGVGKT